MSWIKAGGVTVKAYDEGIVEEIVSKVSEFIDGTEHENVVPSVDLTVSPRVTVLTYKGIDFLLNESASPYGSEGRKVGMMYVANIYRTRKQKPIDWDSPEEQNPRALHSHLRKITNLVLSAKGQEARV